MQQISTPELLVKHLYNETDAEESNMIQQALDNDVNLSASYQQLQEIKNALDDAGGESPDKSIMQNILEYSKQQELTESH